MAKVTNNIVEYWIQIWVNNPILRKVSEEVVDFKEAKKVEKVMLDFLASKKDIGVGLAAPQIGINQRIIIGKFDKTNSTTLVNPKIISHSPESTLDQEWCLSLPWVWWNVRRYFKVHIEYYSIKWKKFELILEDFPARIVQHEIDHLNWILFTDRVIWNLLIDQDVCLSSLGL